MSVCEFEQADTEFRVATMRKKKIFKKTKENKKTILTLKKHCFIIIRQLYDYVRQSFLNRALNFELNGGQST